MASAAAVAYSIFLVVWRSDRLREIDRVYVDDDETTTATVAGEPA
jgi:hypothetical protein